MDVLLWCRREGRGREGSKEAQAERLRDGYRYSFLLSSALIVVIEMRELQPAVQHTRHCDRITCYNLRCFCVTTQDDNSIGVVQAKVRSQHTRHFRRWGWPGPSACVMAIGTRSYCPLHSFIVVIEMRSLQPIAQHTRSK